jgi:predicted membrane protein
MIEVENRKKPTSSREACNFTISFLFEISLFLNSISFFKIILKVLKVLQFWLLMKFLNAQPISPKLTIFSDSKIAQNVASYRDGFFGNIRNLKEREE